MTVVALFLCLCVALISIVAARLTARLRPVPGDPVAAIACETDPQHAQKLVQHDQVNEAACVFFRQHLPAGWVPDYLSRRGFGSGIQQLWQAGYAPASWDGLTRQVTVACHGRRAGVAPCRSAFTAGQASALSRACDVSASGVLVAFDPDQAGSHAAIRAYDVLRQFTPNITAAVLPPGQDPAGILGNGGPETLAMLLHRQTLPLADLVVDAELEKWSRWLDYADGRINALRAAATVVAAMPDASVARQVARLSDRLGIDQEASPMTLLTRSQTLSGERLSHRASVRQLAAPPRWLTGCASAGLAAAGEARGPCSPRYKWMPPLFLLP